MQFHDSTARPPRLPGSKNDKAFNHAVESPCIPTFDPTAQSSRRFLARPAMTFLLVHQLELDRIEVQRETASTSCTGDLFSKCLSIVLPPSVALREESIEALACTADHLLPHDNSMWHALSITTL
jgi:hypothetical protein